MFNFKIPIIDTGKEQVKIGDVYLLTYDVDKSILGMDLSGVTSAFLRWLVDKTKKFDVERSYWNEEGQFVLQCKVMENPLPFLAVFGIIAASSTVLLWMFGMTLNKVEKVVTLPAGQAISYGLALLAVVFTYKTFKK